MADIVIGAGASCVVTELIKVVIQWTQASVKCKSECKKLREELILIEPDVESIERRLVKLRKANCAGDAHKEDLQMVESWLRQLKSAIEIAKIAVHRCNSGRLSLDQIKLSERLTAQFGTITRLGQDRVSLFLALGKLLPAAAQAEVQQQEKRRESPGKSVRKMADERNDAPRRVSPEKSVRKVADERNDAPRRVSPEKSVRKVADERNDAPRREERTRLSMSSSSGSSGHGGWSFDYGVFAASGCGTDSSRAHLLRQGSQAMDVTVFERDDPQYAEAHVSRRHTLAAVTQAPMARAFGHDPLPAHNRWKY